MGVYLWQNKKVESELWPHLDETAKEEARRDMEESAHDLSVTTGRAGGLSHRKHFDKELMDAVRDRDLAWKDAKRVLGDSHEIFNFPAQKKGRKGKRDAAAAPVRAILKLADALNLIRWREEPECVHLLDLTDEQRKVVVRTLRNLLAKLRTSGVASKDVAEKNKRK